MNTNQLKEELSKVKKNRPRDSSKGSGCDLG